MTTVSFLAPLLIALSGDLGVSVAQVGQLVVVTTAAWAICAPFAGLISDRLGRRPVIVVALIGMGLTTLAGAFAGSFWLLAALRLLTGIFGSGGPPSIMAALADHFPPHKRGSAVGWSNTSFSFATLIGVPAVGAIGGIWGWRVAFVVVGLILLGMAGFIRLAFPPGQRGAAGSGNPIRAYGHLFRIPSLGTLLASNVCERVTFMTVSLYFAAFLIQSYGLTPVTVAPALALTAIGTVVGTIAGGMLADRLPQRRVAFCGLVACGLFGLAAFLWPLGLIWTLGLAFGFGLTNASGRPAFIALLFNLSDRHRGGLVGLVAATNQLGQALGAALGGLVIGWAGFTGLGPLILVLALTGAGLISISRLPSKTTRGTESGNEDSAEGGSGSNVGAPGMRPSAVRAGDTPAVAAIEGGRKGSGTSRSGT